MEDWFESKEERKCYDHEGEVYLLEYGIYTGQQRILRKHEIYTTLRAAEERISFLLRKCVGFNSFRIRNRTDVYLHDWGIVYTATKKNPSEMFAQFIVRFECLRDKPILF